MRRLLAIAAASLMSTTAVAHAARPPIHHVYVIVLENQSASTTFGPTSPAPYLSKSLRAQGAYVPNYYGIGHESNDNYIAMISGQAPNIETQTDCQFFNNFLLPATTKYGQETGVGCVYPASIPTIASQFTNAGLAWRDYNDGMGADPKREASVCGHPPVGGRDKTQSATRTDQYAARHNPFVYFHAIIDNTKLCDAHVVNLKALPQDLARTAAPNYVFITPNLCHDGHDAKCANGGPGGLAQADRFLRRWVPKITGSRAFRRDGGLLLITFDEAATSDSHACCKEAPGPGSPKPGIGGPGGGDVGAVLLSPYIKPHTVSKRAYNHYTMLRSVEDLFGLPHIGYAQLPGERSFGSDIFACAPARKPVAVAGRLPAGSEVEHVRISGRRLILYSVGNAALKVVVSAPGRSTVTIRRTLVPCTRYSILLPGGQGRHVAILAQAYGGAQKLSY